MSEFDIKKVEFSDLKVKDVHSFVQLIRDANYRYIDKFIYGYNGIEEVIISNINENNIQYKYFTCKFDNEVIASLEVRINENSVFINYIAVDEKFRNKSIGRKLIFFSIHECLKIRNDIFSIGLDVISHNLGAFRLYRKLGFDITSNYNWYIYKNFISIKDIDSDKFEVLDIYKCNQINKKRGFSNFDIIYNDNRINVGMIGEKYFRIVSFFDKHFVEYLINMDKNREVIIIVNDDIKEEENLYKLFTSFRMEVELDNILSKEVVCYEK